jgi:small subunit ribosomal protein S27Ae
MGKKSVKKGKKPHKNKPTSKKYKMYKIDGDAITRGRFCPRCGPGVFLMNSQGRFYCGKCHYSEFEGKKVEEKKEVKEETKKE